MPVHCSYVLVLALTLAAQAKAATERDAPAAIIESPTPAAEPVDDEATRDDDEDEDEEVGDDGEAEARDAVGGPDRLYTADLADAELERRFVEELTSLGSISVGFADAGRIINAVSFPPGDAWTLVTPNEAWAVQETIDGIMAVARAVRARFPSAPPLRVNHLSRREGGYLRPHKSHQSGRDVDFGFFYKADLDSGSCGRDRTRCIDPALNWELVRALATESDPQVILVDRKIQKVLYDYARAEGEDVAWLDALFRGPTPLVQHARRHRDHFHVRFFAPRAQELGRRVQPLLAKRPDENLAMVRVRSGDTLGHLASRYGSSVKAIQTANHMRSTLLSIGRVLVVPMRGPCTKCPQPPPVVVGPRRLPPSPRPVPRESVAAVAVEALSADAAPPSEPAAAAPPSGDATVPAAVAAPAVESPSALLDGAATAPPDLVTAGSSR